MPFFRSRIALQSDESLRKMRALPFSREEKVNNVIGGMEWILIDCVPPMEAEEKKTPWKIEPLLAALALLLLLGGCFFVLRPFFTALMWAIILSYSLHPLQRLFTRWFRGARTLAACMVTLTVIVVIAGPVVLIGLSLAEDGKELAGATRDWFMDVPDQPPGWVSGMPLVGDELSAYWVGIAEERKDWVERITKEVHAHPRAKIVDESGDHLVLRDPDTEPGEDVNDRGVGPDGQVTGDDDTASGSPQVVVMLGRFLAWARSGLISVGLAVGQGVTQVLLSAFLTFFLLRDAPVLSERLTVAAERLAGERGRHLMKVAGDTVRGVIFGILGTAIAQALVAGLGFWIAGIPGVVLLAVLTFFFAVIPFGPPLVWVPASLWLFAQDRPAMGIFLLIWGVVGISSVDNFLRPYLISQNSKMPFILIFCGVIGGALAFGLVGVFLGPTLLAVGFRLIEEWSDSHHENPMESTGEVIS